MARRGGPVLRYVAFDATENGLITPARKFLNVLVTLRVTKWHHAERDEYDLSCRGNNRSAFSQSYCHQPFAFFHRAQ